MTRRSPGRNNPCPCGSGRKYKACCLKADRRARDAGAGGVALTPEVIARAREADVWQTELVPFQASIADDAGARPAVALVMAGEWVLHAELHRRPTGEPDEVGSILADAVAAAADRIGGAPARLEARHADVVTALRERLGSEPNGGVEVVLATRLHPLDAAAAELVEGRRGGGFRDDDLDFLPPSRPCTSAAETWKGWSLPGTAVPELFDAAAAFYRARPWETLGDEEPLEVETAEGRVWAASVLGGGGVEVGLSLYADPEDLVRIMGAPGSMPEVGDFTGRCLCLTFETSDRLPPPMRREVMRAGWTVAAPEAYPYLFTINTPGGGVSRVDVGDLSAALRALAEGAAPPDGVAGDDGGTAWRDPETGTTVRATPPDRWPGDAALKVVFQFSSTEDEATLHRLRVTLADVSPPVWRRIEVPSDLPLWALHEVLQAAMGWEDRHLYSFEVDGVEYGEADDDGWLEFADADVPLSEVAGSEGDGFTYVYDFGDEWIHELTVEAVEPAEPGLPLPRCLDGARACPPEDCGGPGGYGELVEALRDPEGEEAREWIRWAGEDFDPEAFDVDEANRRLEALTAGTALDPACAPRLDALLEMLFEDAEEEGLPEELVDEAAELLTDYALDDPEGFLSGRKPEILVAASLHAAGMLLDTPWSGWRPTLEELAAHWGVSTASISNRSNELRDRVPRPTGLDRLLVEASEHARRFVESMLSLGGDPGALVDAAGFRPRPGPPDPEVLAELTGLGEEDTASLRSALLRGLDRERRERGRSDRDHRSLAERLEDDSAFGSALREVLRDDRTTPGARDALARWILAGLAVAVPLGMEPIPTSSLLALSHLADRKMLWGEALRSALVMALAVAPDPAERLGAGEIRPLVAAVGSDPELDEADRVALLRDLVERTVWGRDGREGPALVELIAGEEAIPASVRHDTLLMVSGLVDPAPAGREAGPATRRRALILWAEMKESPEALIGPLLDEAVDDDVPGRAAAELMEAHGSALPRPEIEALVRRGFEDDHVPVRQAFFGAARTLLGDDVLRWAPDDVLERARRRPGGRGSPDQTTLF